MWIKMIHPNKAINNIKLLHNMVEIYLKKT